LHCDALRRGPNIDDGDLNYLGKAVFSKSLSAVTEISLSYKSFGCLPVHRRA